MKSNFIRLRQGFTLLETVIAIGVLAVLLTGFMVVFTPAADGIRKSINVQQADRFASTLEEELVTLRPGVTLPPGVRTGFDQAFNWIMSSNAAATSLVAYQYRGDMNNLRQDRTPTPVVNIISETDPKIPGKDYVVVSMVRRKSDQSFLEDLRAVEGAVYMVRCTQLVFGTNGMVQGTAGVIRDPRPNGTNVMNADAYPEAVIAFAAEFHMLPSKDPGYFNGPYNTRFANFRNPVFTRNLAVRR
jgi:prepilin-type N-terminal cleavage/methylation domain-containing protein